MREGKTERRNKVKINTKSTQKKGRGRQKILKCSICSQIETLNMCSVFGGFKHWLDFCMAERVVFLTVRKILKTWDGAEVEFDLQ